MEIITSRANARLKEVRALIQSGKERAQQGLCVVEGLAHVGAAIEAQATIQTLYFAPELLRSEYGKKLVDACPAPKFALSAEAFESISSREHGAGILAIVQMPTFSLKTQTPSGLTVALHQPQDPGNVGTILRTLDAVGGGLLLLVDGGTDASHPQAVRASMGALFSQRVIACSWAEMREWAIAHRLAVVGTSAKNARDYREFEWTAPLLLVFGAERSGLSAEQRADCTHLVSLPMRGKVSSLNLAVAVGILLYSAQAHILE